MRKAILYILAAATALWAISGATVPNTFSANTLARSATMNTNFDSVEVAIDRVADTLNISVPRWNTFKDTTIDTVYFRYADIDTLGGAPFAPSMAVGYIGGDTADFDTVLAGVVSTGIMGATSIGATSANITSVTVDTLTGGDLGVDSVTCTKVNSGQGWTEVYLQDQNTRTTDGPTFATINTGNGAAEVYLQDQNTRTTDDVVHDSLSLTDLRVSDDVTVVDRLNVSGIATFDSVVAGDIGADSIGGTKFNSGNGWAEIYLQDQNLRTTDDPTFTNGVFTGTLRCDGNATLGNASTDAHIVNGATIFAPGVQSYKFGNRSTAAYLQSQTSGVVAALGLHTADGDGTDALGISLWAKGTPLSYTVRENLNIEYDNTNRRYLVFSGAVGTGAVLLPIVLSAAGNATQLVLNTDNSVSMSGALTAASLTTAGASTVGSLTTDTLAGITTIAGSWYQDTAFACTLSRVGYTSTLSYNATHKDSIGTCRIVKTGANYNVYLYDFDAMVTASSFGLMYLKSVLPVAWRPNGTYSWMIGDNGGANFATGSYDPSSYRWMFSFETGNSMWLTAFATSYTK
jgi:hypothetical protein